MNQAQLKEIWKHEEDIAHIHGWDFSHIHGRYVEEDNLPWDFRAVIQSYREDSMKLMDMETGGGEFLLSLHHPAKNTAAIEGYPPNVELCKNVLLPLEIDFMEANGCDSQPIRFFDAGALVWFARIIEWEFPDFSVDKCLQPLYRAQEMIDQNGVIEGSIHRFYIVARI